MTIKQAKADITKTSEALHRDGLTVRSILVDWTAEVALDDKKPAPEAAIRCDLTIEADF